MSNELDQRDLMRFTTERCERAFTAIVERHLPMVLATAQRFVHDHALAQDIAQQVFTKLVAQASTLREKRALRAWLYQHCVFVAHKTLRSERRRQRREHLAAVTMNEEEATPDEVWQSLKPNIDNALSKLSEADRDAIVLRFFGEQSLREIGTALGVGEDAAQKRVSRALERLRQQLQRVGITTSQAGLTAALIVGGQVVAIPPTLAQGIATQALSTSPKLGLLGGSLLGHGAAILIGATAALGLRASHGLMVSDAPILAESAAQARPSILTSVERQQVLKSKFPEIQRLARLPATGATTRQLQALLEELSPSQYLDLAESLNASTVQSAAWYRIQDLLFPLWCEADPHECLDYLVLESPRNRSYPRRFLQALESWNGDRLPDVKQWFLTNIAPKEESGRWANHGIWAAMGAQLAAKDPSDFEAFLKRLPDSEPFRWNSSEEFRLVDNVRRNALAQVSGLPPEQQRQWAETLTDPEERADVVMSMFHKVFKQDLSKEPNKLAAKQELADWAWAHLDENQRANKAIALVRKLSDLDPEGSVDWMRQHASPEELQRVALGMIRYRPYPRPSPEAQIAWAETLPDPEIKEHVIAGLFRRWARDRHRDSLAYESAEEFLTKTSMPSERAESLRAILLKP